MARAWRWLSGIRSVLARSSCTSAADLDAIKSSTTIYNPITVEEPPEVSAVRDAASVLPEGQDAVLVHKRDLSREDLAAITIQAFFRGHLARRAFRALKSLVRLQAVVRGVRVRRQARVAMHCMQALVRLQVRVRARQLLGKSAEVEVGA